MDVSLRKTTSGVLASGVLHYQDNQKYSLLEMLRKVQSYVSIGGIILIQYLQPGFQNTDSRRFFMTAEQMASYFDEAHWHIIDNTSRTQTEGPNPRNPLPHSMLWGDIFARKLDIQN